MPVTITLKNIPDSVYQNLKRSAEANRRSLNMEAITVLEKALASESAVGVEERIARIRRLTENLPALKRDHEDPADVIRRERDARTARHMAFVDETVARNQGRPSPKRKGKAS